jgi:ribosome biogenesis GTPase
LRTQAVSDYHKKGRHTTTHSEMFPLPDGGYLIDSPGIKELGIAHFKTAELSHYFPEMRPLLEQCKFADCQHDNEPKCAIRAAVEAGKIAPSRYRSYLGLLQELREEAQNEFL